MAQAGEIIDANVAKLPPREDWTKSRTKSTWFR